MSSKNVKIYFGFVIKELKKNNLTVGVHKAKLIVF